MSPNEFAQRLHLDLAQFIARTRGVFELLAWGSDVSRNATARRMGHDLRSFDLMREAPSMMLLVDLARAVSPRPRRRARDVRDRPRHPSAPNPGR